MNQARYRKAEQALWKAVGVEQVTEQRVRLRCTDTEVRVQVTGEGEPLVLVHGGPNAGATWAPLIAHLRGFRCYMVDRPGTGLSEDYVVRRAELPSIADQFLADLLSGLRVERAHVVASSLGGYLALRSAATSPDRIGRMVQMACPAFAPGMLTPSFMRMLRFRFLRWLIPKLPPTRSANVNILRQIGHGASLTAGRIPESFFEWYGQLLRHTHTMRNDFAIIGDCLVGDCFDPALALDSSVLERVRTPTLFLWGADDGFGGEEIATKVVSPMPDAQLEMIPESGHLPWLDAPKAIAAKTAAFLQTEPVRPRKQQLHEHLAS